MLRLISYVKPYRKLVLLAIILLFIQANLELALPDYLSNIVDVGVQQGGIEHAVPLAIRQTQLDRVSIFLTKENQSTVLGHYKLINENSSDYGTYIKDYPALVNQSVYVIKNKSDIKSAELNDILQIPMVIVFSLEGQLERNATGLFSSMNLTIPNTLPSASIPQYFFTILGQFPAEAITVLETSIMAYYNSLGSTLLDQVSIAAVRGEYAAVGVNTSAIQRAYLIQAGLMMVLVTVLAAICTVFVSYLAAKTAAGMARDIRSDVFQKVESFSSTEFDQFSTASLITRSTNDIMQIQNVTYLIIRIVFYAPIIGVGGMIHALAKAPSMWWLIAVAVGFLIVMIIIIFILAVPKFKAMQKFTDKINLVSREGLSGMLVVRAFNMEKHEEKKFDDANVDLTSVSLYVNRLMVVLMPFMMLIMNGLTIGILWVGAHEVADTTIQVGDMMAFMQYAIQIVFAFLMLSMMFIIFPRAVVSGNRIMEVMRTEPQIKDPEIPKSFSEDFQGIIEFKDVSFRHHGAKQDAVEHISFVANPGETTAFIGSTGAGKSTIISLIPRFYEVSEGAILIDGVDIRDVTQHHLREKIAYVPQKSSLFSGTIESNVKFGDEAASEDEVHASLLVAQAEDFVTSKEKGIHSEISQAGANVSGGQKQRLSIARALAKKAPIYLFDDSVSALDFKTEAALRKALKPLIEHSTVLMVSQRVSTVKNAEQIIVLDDGIMVGKGTHDELLQSCEIYAEIAESQLELEG